MAGEAISQAVAAPEQAAPPPSQQIQSASPPQSQAPPPSPVPETPTSGTGAETPSFVPVHEAVRGYGYDLPQGLEGHAALQHLVAEARRSRDLAQHAQYGQEYLRHYDQFQGYLRQQQEAEKAKKEQREGWWKAPEHDPGWTGKLYKDQQTGEIKVLPGNDPSILNKYNAWLGHQQQFLDKFSQDPISAIKPGIEQVARQVAQEIIQQQLGGYQDSQLAGNFVAQNSSWLHERDQAGQSTGRLSPAGQTFARYVREAEGKGLRTVQDQQDYALTKLQRDAAVAAYRAGRAPQQVEQRQQDTRQQFADQYNPPRNGSGVAAGAVNVAPPPAGQLGQRDLERQLMAAMRAGGYQAGQQLEAASATSAD